MNNEENRIKQLRKRKGKVGRERKSKGRNAGVKRVRNIQQKRDRETERGGKGRERQK